MLKTAGATVLLHHRGGGCKMNGNAPKEELSLRKRLFIGCLGALAPILVNLYVIDLQTTLNNLLPLEAASYAVRLVALCASACIVIYLNGDESRPAKLFQLGIMAPAMLTSMLNGAAIANKTPASPTPPPPRRIPRCSFRKPMRNPRRLLPARRRRAIAQSRTTRPSPNRF